jgi:hypothetical protein
LVLIDSSEPAKTNCIDLLANYKKCREENKRLSKWLLIAENRLNKLSFNLPAACRQAGEAGSGYLLLDDVLSTILSSGL